jgi:hypothetical protein
MFQIPSRSRIFCVFLCAAIPLSFGPIAKAESVALETLLAAKPTKSGLTLTVSTGGCTKKSDFEIASHRIRKGVASIEARRLMPDVCKGNFPDGMKLSFTWAELKVPKKTKILIRNPIERQGRSARNHRSTSVRHIARRGCRHRVAKFPWPPATKFFLRIAN